MDVNLKNTPSEIDRLIDKYKSTVYGIAIARLGSKADADDVFCAVTELPEKYRMVVYLYYFEEVSTDEIAEIMKVRSGTVRMQLTRAREMLKEKLKGGYFYE